MVFPIWMKVDLNSFHLWQTWIIPLYKMNTRSLSRALTISTTITITYSVDYYYVVVRLQVPTRRIIHFSLSHLLFDEYVLIILFLFVILLCFTEDKFLEQKWKSKSIISHQHQHQHQHHHNNYISFFLDEIDDKINNQKKDITATNAIRYCSGIHENVTNCAGPQTITNNIEKEIICCQWWEYNKNGENTYQKKYCPLYYIICTPK